MIYYMKAEYYKLLKEYIWFKSISTNPDKQFSIEIQNCAKRLNDLFKSHNFKVQIINDYGNPIIIASYEVNKELETWLIYGHYDVQSANQIEWRKEDPFNLYMRKDKIIWRWVVDNKWQTLIHMINIFQLIKEWKLAYNIIFVLEWEEEIWSNGIDKFIQENSKKIKADFIMVSDGNIIQDMPVIESWFRWWFNAKLEIQTANTDLHTWIYGGVIPNAIEELNKLFSKLHDINNQVTIPYFYYEAEEVSAIQKTINKQIPFNSSSLEDSFDIKHTKLQNIDFYSKTGLTPCVEITGISWGHTDYFKNSVPNKATANINFRLVYNQKCDTIKNLFEERIKNTLPKHITYKLSFDLCNKAIKLNNNNKYSQKARILLEKIYNNKVINIYSGWSLPIISTFQEHITSNILSIPLANEDCNMHWINENFKTDLIDKGFQFSYNFFQK